MTTLRMPTVSRLALLCVAWVLAGSARAEPADWQIDAEHFSIVFGADHVGYQQQLGMFLEGAGQFRYDLDSGVFESGRVEILAASLFSNHEARDDHLKGRDFLDARRHPRIVFEATGFEPADASGQQGTLRGQLTLLGETHPVDLQVTLNKRAPYPFLHRRETLGISAQATILRSTWGMDYGVADGLVGDAVTLRFEFEAIRQ